MSKLIIRPLSGIAEVIYNNGADYRVCTITDDESVEITIDSDLEFFIDTDNSILVSRKEDKD